MTRATPPPAHDPSRPVPAPVQQEPAKPGPDEWQPGMPLLGVTRPPRPDERRSTLNGWRFDGLPWEQL